MTSRRQQNQQQRLSPDHIHHKSQQKRAYPSPLLPKSVVKILKREPGAPPLPIISMTAIDLKKQSDRAANEDSIDRQVHTERQVRKDKSNVLLSSSTMTNSARKQQQEEQLKMTALRLA